MTTAGVASVLPAASCARTMNLCIPSSRSASPAGDEQELNGALSRLQAKVDPLSLAAKAIESPLDVVNEGTFVVTVVSGGAVSTVKPADCAAEAIPLMLRAATEKT